MGNVARAQIDADQSRTLLSSKFIWNMPNSALLHWMGTRRSAEGNEKQRASTRANLKRVDHQRDHDGTEAGRAAVIDVFADG